MRITWFSWKDYMHPEAGGAEQIADIILSGLVRDGHVVTLVTARYSGSKEIEVAKGGYTITRTGGHYSVYLQALKLLILGKYHDTDLFVDEASGIPFFTALFAWKKPVVTVFYHIQRKIWFYQMPFPLNIFGYLLEPLWVFLLGLRSALVVTISDSTKYELMRFGVSNKKIVMIPISIEIPRIGLYEERKETAVPTILALGALRPMKKPLSIIEAFTSVQEKIPTAKLILAGGGAESTYGKKVLRAIKESPAHTNIEYKGRITKEEKISLLRSSWVLLAASVKEGWGLIATEAHSQGLPTIVNDVPGLRDSTKNKVTGFVVEERKDEIARATIHLLEDTKLRHLYGQNALEDSVQYVPEKTYSAFLSALKNHKLI